MGDILVVDDEKDIRELVSDILVDEGYTTRIAANSDQTFAAINKEAPDLIVLDIWLKQSRLDGIDILKAVRRDNPGIPIVIISGHGNIEIAVAAVKQGAYDFIEKPFNIDQLTVVIARAMEASQLRRENARLRIKDISSSVIVGSSSAFRKMQTELDRVAKTNSRLLLTGLSGCGKEVAARYIHSRSDRANGPFISVNSASIEAVRMEEVLFGREGENEPGLLEQADGGILFFDEVADMPIGTQSKILRVLVEQQFTRIDGSGKVRVDIRILSATTRNLEQEIAAGTFREELYHRLNVVPVAVPSLEARREDIAILAQHFVEQFNVDQGLPLRRLGADTEALLQTRLWPGNIRQLRNVIERILILGPKEGEIETSEIPGNDSSPDSGTGGLSDTYIALPLREARVMFEREYLSVQINRFCGNISRTANFVGMERTAFHRKMKSLNMNTTYKANTRTAAVEDEMPDDLRR